MRVGFSKLIIALSLSLFFVSVNFSQTYCTELNAIKQVKNTSIGNAEYLIFDIIKDTDSTNSVDYSVETASPPFTGYVEDDGEIPVKGSKFKKIVFRSINWMCQTRDRTKTPRSAIKDFKELYKFEGIAEYVVGYRSGSKYITTYQYDAGSVIKVVLKFKK